MTESEAKNYLDELHGKILNSRFAENCTENEIIALIESKIAWMELERYHAIGTVSDFREFKEKAKKAVLKKGVYHCPSCGMAYAVVLQGYCTFCGQHMN